MGRARQRRQLYVAMNGHEVGVLHRDASRTLRFQYSQGWLDTSSPTPISLSLPLSTEPYSGEEVYNFFDNLLPDNDDIRRRMQTALGSDSTEPFDLLSRAGSDCVGALQLFDSSSMPDIRQVNATRVSDAQLAEMLRNYRQRPLGMAPEEDDFRISIAGAQEKTGFLWYRNAWHRPRATTPTTHLFKLPIGPTNYGIDLRHSVENEWLCLKIAAAFGLPTPKTRIERFEDVTVLVVERFDRRWSDDRTWLIRLPTEDMCQSLGVSSAQKYESHGGPGMARVMDLLLQSQIPDEDRRTFFRACVVYWLLAAIDGHAKNFSVFLHARGRCNLTPLYDVMSAYPLAPKLSPAERTMAMSVLGKNRHYKWQEFVRRHWLATAKACYFPQEDAEAVLDDCASKVDSIIDQVGQSLPSGFPDEVADPIFSGLLSARKRIER